MPLGSPLEAEDIIFQKIVSLKSEMSTFCSDSSDVTLASKDACTVCKHFQTGYCKFREHCKKRHEKTVCPSLHCSVKACTKRHPKSCKFYALNQFCKFGDSCCYKHVDSGNMFQQLKALQMKVGQLEQAVQALESEIVVLKDINNCDVCDFKATSKAGLKSHITKKHRNVSQPALEKERDENLSNSLHVSLPYVEREEHVTDHFPEVVERKSIQCEWTYCCSYVANSTKDMIEHVSATHTITSSFVFPDSSKTEICEECGMEFFMDHAYAMHLYTDHKLAFNCDHCLEFLPGCEGGFIEIHMELCTAPCNGDPNCACTW